MGGYLTPPSRWYLIAGPTGAGKTTITREKASGSCVRFSIDEWMSNLYWMDCPQKEDYPWAIERVRRCEEQIAAVAVQLASIGVHAALDLGFSSRKQRLAWCERARAAGAIPQLEVVNPSAEVRWQRVLKRNAAQSGTFSFAVTREMFDAMEKLWEPVDAEERAAFVAAQAISISALQ
jgi:predicted kinase